MPVTINANGLSIIHKDSGGKASATLPDVCLTVVGPSVVPIPYTNSAKSSDLADGSKTVTADGGNSIAIKGCSFSKSSGDAAGTNKGIVSGTTEGKAEFITSSPTVKIEGKGVCRLSDQMTMNSMNTMCLGGAQNPPVTVIEDPEGTYTVDLYCRYPDGEPLQNAPFKLIDIAGKILKEGELDAQGKGSIGSLPNTLFKIEYGEHGGKFCIKQPRSKNSQCTTLDNETFFDKASQMEQPFWNASSINHSNHWGAIGPSLSDSIEIRGILQLEASIYFKRHLTNEEAQDIAKSLIRLLVNQSENTETLHSLIASISPLVEDDGEVLSLCVHYHEEESNHNLLANMRGLGTGNPALFLDELDWESSGKAISSACIDILNSAAQRLTSIEFEAGARHYSHVSENVITHRQAMNDLSKRLPEDINGAMTNLQTKVKTIRAKGEPAMVIRNPGSGRSSTVREVPDLVYTINALPKPLELSLTYDDREKTPAGEVPYLVTFANNEKRAGTLCKKGKATLYGVPQMGATIEFGDADTAQKAKEDLANNYESLGNVLKKAAIEQAKKAIEQTPKDTLKKTPPEVLKELKRAVDAQRVEMKEQGKAFNDLNLLEQGIEGIKALFQGVKEGFTGYIPDISDDFTKLLDKSGIDVLMLMKALVTGDIDLLERKLGRLSVAERKALGLIEASETMEMLIILLSDKTSREYLASLPRLFLESMPPEQAVEFFASQGTQKGIDAAVYSGGVTLATAASAPAAGSAGVATGVILAGVLAARNAGKTIKQLIEVLEKIKKNKKDTINQHQKDESELPKGKCPICDDEKCKNRMELKKGKGFNTNPNKSRHLKKFKEVHSGYPKSHPWYIGAKSLAIHHVIPIESVADIKFKNLFDLFKYDINNIKNLVILPALPSLACVLSVQVHYTNHNYGMALSKDEEELEKLVNLEKERERLNEELKLLLSGKQDTQTQQNISENKNKQEKNISLLNDFSKSLVKKHTNTFKSSTKPYLNYTVASTELITDIFDLIEKGRFCSDPESLFSKKIETYSKKILENIKNYNWTISWDSRDYQPDSPYGCCGIEKTKDHKTKKMEKRDQTCPNQRKHHSLPAKYIALELELGK